MVIIPFQCVRSLYLLQLSFTAVTYFTPSCLLFRLSIILLCSRAFIFRFAG